MKNRPPKVAVVIPCYQVEKHVGAVIRSIPDWVEWIIAVDDASSDGTAIVLERAREERPALSVLRHDVNRGVGGAMKTGFELASANGADIVAKLDGDGQMDPDALAALIQPLLEGRAEMSKGNRLCSAASAAQMPRMRLIGNIAMTFLTKLATGYWHIFDVQNGYLAIRREALQLIPLKELSSGYFFENSLLGWLSIHGQVVIDVPIPAIYGDEESHLRPWRVMASFPQRLCRLFLRRIYLRYVVYDVSPIALYLALGGGGLAFGTIFGLYHWYRSISTGIPASTGTVMVALLTFLLGFNMVLQAVHLDILESRRPRPPTAVVPLDQVAGYLRQESIGGPAS